MSVARKLVTITPGAVDCSPAAPLRFRRHLPGEEGESEADRRLTGSVKRFGVIQPPILAGPAGGDTGAAIVIDGHRRLGAARAAGLDALEALLVPAESTTDGEILALRFEAVPSGRPPSELELVILSRKAAEFAGAGPEDCMRQTEGDDIPAGWRGGDGPEKGAPGARLAGDGPGTGEDLAGLLRTAFGKQLSSCFLVRLWSLLELDDATLESLHTGMVSTGDLLLLMGERHIDVGRAVQILSSEKLNRREQKEAVRLMVRLADLGENEWRTFLERRRTGKKGLIDILHACCYPTLAGDLELVRKIADSMQLPPGAALHAPEHMESGHYRLELRFRRAEQFDQIVKKLAKATAEGKIDELAGILRGEQCVGGCGEKEKGAHRVGCSRSLNLEL